MSEPPADDRQSAAAPPESRGCAVIGLALLGGAAIGLIVGALAGYGVGMAWIEFMPAWNRAREMGVAVVLVFMPAGAVLGAVLGAIIAGRRTARRGSTVADRILLVAAVILAALAALGLFMLPPLLRLWAT